MPHGNYTREGPSSPSPCAIDCNNRDIPPATQAPVASAIESNNRDIRRATRDRSADDWSIRRCNARSRWGRQLSPPPRVMVMGVRLSCTHTSAQVSQRAHGACLYFGQHFPVRLAKIVNALALCGQLVRKSGRPRSFIQVRGSTSQR